MASALQRFSENLANTTADNLATWVESSVPTLVRVVILLVLAYVGIKLLLFLLRRTLRRVYGERREIVADLIVTVVGVGLWFGVALSVLATLGMSQIAASMGTATGFIALGISYALSGMIEDTVAGIYLLKDPDFELGDRVKTDKGEGIVRAIELRKCRLEQDDGDTLVLANADIEKRWTNVTAGDEADEAAPAAAD